MKKLLVALCLAAVPAAAESPELGAALARASALASATQAAPGMPGNFHEVAPGLYRSAQPSREGYKQLKKLGVKTLLSLKDNDERERKEAGAAGLAVENVPMGGFLRPSFEEIDRALAILVDPSKRPILVHCQFGKDRTGFVIASYRVIVEHMDEAKAVAEAQSYGCCIFSFGDLTKFLKAYSVHRAKTP